MKKQLAIFIIRWAATSFGIWLAVELLGGIVPGAEPTVWTYIGAGLAFSIVNSLLKPIITILSLPAILLTLGLFMLVVNGLMVYLSLLLVPSLKLSFGEAIVAGVILSLINYTVSGLLEFHADRSKRPRAWYNKG
jgi:putative membrane protein